MEIAVRPFPGFQGIVASRFNPVDECRLKENISDPTGPLFHTIVPFGSGDKYCGMISTLIVSVYLRMSVWLCYGSNHYGIWTNSRSSSQCFYLITRCIFLTTVPVAKF